MTRTPGRDDQAQVVAGDPYRIQRQRTKGWRMPEGAVYVGRPGLWGNPFRVGDRNVPTPGVAVRLYARLMEVSPESRALARDRLAGRNLVCWCALTEPCHADVLLRVANAPGATP